MKWVLSHASDDIRHWQLQQENRSRSLIINLQRRSLRLDGNSKRLFFLEVQGVLQKKVLLRTEYGITIGETALTDKLPGPLLLNGHKFFYRLENDQWMLLDNERGLVDVCEFPVSPPSRLEVYGLAFGFAWFTTADAVAEKENSLPAPV
jgi:hypothetical protein